MKKVISIVSALVLFAPFAAFASVGITLQGGSVTVPQGQSYVEPGYSAFSTVDGDITNQVVVSNPGTSQVGDFTVGYSVTDSDSDSASAFRDLTITQSNSGGDMLFCSGSMAPGWHVDEVGGGCGSTKTFYQAGHALPDGTVCEFNQGCML